AQEGDTLEIGAAVCQIEEVDAAAEPKETEKQESAKPKETEEKPSDPADEKGGSSYAKGSPSPAATKILNEKGINASDIEGTGKDGRITKNDAVNATPKTKAPSDTPQKTEETSGGDFSGDRSERREKLSSL